MGLLFADVEHHLIRTHYADTGELDYDRINSALSSLIKEATSTLTDEGYDAAHQSSILSADTRYMGQEYALAIPLSSDMFTPETTVQLIEDFQQEHDRTYGYRSENEGVRVVALRVIARDYQMK